MDYPLCGANGVWLYNAAAVFHSTRKNTGVSCCPYVRTCCVRACINTHTLYHRPPTAVLLQHSNGWCV